MRRLTWSRWWHLVRHPENTLYRLLENEVIEGMELGPLVLDVGGGASATYWDTLRSGRIIHAVNIDPRMRPTALADAAGLPFREGTYGSVVSFNLLEHVLEEQAAMREMWRVLSPGGQVHIAVPFLYRVHGSPSDFHRHTADYWRLSLLKAGFEPESIYVEPLLFGAWSAALSLVEFRRGRFTRQVMRAVVLSRPLLRRDLQRLEVEEDGVDAPVGYYLRARKRD